MWARASGQLTRHVRITVMLLVVALLGAGCGDDEAGTPAATAAPASAVSSSSTTQGAPTVAVADTDLGPVLVDGQGFTLYRFTEDAEGVSNCTDACAEAWPPVIHDGELLVGDRLDATRFGTVTRPDETVQLTVDGLPLYRFAADTEPGHTNGQGSGGVWFAVTPDGQLVGPEGAGANDGATSTTGDGAATSTTFPPLDY
jgi:predicted lipoprotein with Yx(FWY)xxD motif